MKVYVVTIDDDDSYILGVYSNHLAAVEAVIVEYTDRFGRDRVMEYKDIGLEELHPYWIDEMEVQHGA